MNKTFLGDVVLTTRQLINKETKQVLDIVFQVSLFSLTCIFGLVANTINITVYRKQGLRDSITLGFFTLSISDLVVILSTMPIPAVYIAPLILPNAPIHFIGFYFVTTKDLRQMAYSFSTILTAFLSVERCCCVILPFQVKMIFTRKRTFIFIISLLLFHIACFVPVYATHQLRWMSDPTRNNTKVLRVWFSSDREQVEAFNYTLMSIITPICAQVVIICSSSIMVNGLRSSSKFRQMATGKGGEKEESDGGLTSRDARLVKSMVFVGCILTLCNIPYLALVSAILVVPEFNMGKAYHNTYSVVFSISILLAVINSSANVFVYYNISNKYRQIFQETFCCKKTNLQTLLGSLMTVVNGLSMSDDSLPL